VAGDTAYGATVAKRRLARRLAALRVRSGLSLNEASDKLGWSRGRLNRFEANQWRLPDASHVRDLARIYGADDGEREELEDLVTRARARLWWHEPDRERDRVFTNEFAGFENDAARISVYLPLLVPGLLQTPAYARALLSLCPGDERWRERALAARLRRQQILDRSDGTVPRLVAVVTEASLLYRWGSQADRRAQVAHLAAVSRRPAVELRLLRFAGGLHLGMGIGMQIFDFPDDDEPAAVYLEGETDIVEVTRPAEAEAYKATFARVREAALTPAATRAHLDTLTTTLE